MPQKGGKMKKCSNNAKIERSTSLVGDYDLTPKEIKIIEEDLYKYSKEKLGFGETDAKKTAKIMTSGFRVKNKYRK